MRNKGQRVSVFCATTTLSYRGIPNAIENRSCRGSDGIVIIGNDSPDQIQGPSSVQNIAEIPKNTFAFVPSVMVRYNDGKIAKDADGQEENSHSNENGTQPFDGRIGQHFDSVREGRSTIRGPLGSGGDGFEVFFFIVSGFM